MLFHFSRIGTISSTSQVKLEWPDSRCWVVQTHNVRSLCKASKLHDQLCRKTGLGNRATHVCWSVLSKRQLQPSLFWHHTDSTSAFAGRRAIAGAGSILAANSPIC